tara:strand:- start:214 stop:537 length:324 start_codon:yes stop_codon:yes gene_type:complete
MVLKKTIFGLIILIFLGACTSPTAMLGPAYTLSSTGNIYQASFSYGTNEIITNYTGKSPIENLQEITNDKKIYSKNIKKKTLESEDFYILVKNKIENAKGTINLSNQ